MMDSVANSLMFFSLFLGGALGGIFESLISTDPKPDPVPNGLTPPAETSDIIPWRKLLRELILGVVAALIVPLILWLTNSELMNPNSWGAFSFAALKMLGLGIVAGASARSLMSKVSDTLLKRMNELEKKVNSANFNSLANGLSHRDSASPKQIAAGFNLVQQQSAQLGPTYPPNAGRVTDDPWNGAFGAVHSVGNSKLTISWEPCPGMPGWLSISIRIQVPAGTPNSMDGVRVFLHPLLPQYERTVAVYNCVAALNDIRSYGAFTIGVVIGDVKGAPAKLIFLEYDLAKLPDAPQDWKDR